MNYQAENTTEERLRTNYRQCTVDVCFADVKKIVPDVNRISMMDDPIVKRDNFVLRATHFKLTSNLSAEIREKFDLGMGPSMLTDKREDILPYGQRLADAYQSIGVPPEVVEKMIEDAKPQITPIPEFEVVTWYSAVPVVVPPATPYCDQWLARLDKQAIEKLLQTGWNVNLVAVSVGGSLGPTLVV
jgi:hypothetical protein